MKEELEKTLNDLKERKAPEIDEISAGCIGEKVNKYVI